MPPGAGRQRFRRAPLLVALLTAVTVAEARAQQDTSLTEAVLQVSIMRGPSTTLLALARDTALLLPMRGLLDLMAIRVGEVVPGVRFTGSLEPGDTAFAVETEFGAVTRGRDGWSIPSDRAVWRDGELYLASADVMRLLGVSLTMDWSELVLTVGNTERLPSVVRIQREERRAALLRSREPPPVPIRLLSRRRAVADGAVLDWGLTSATRGPLDNTSVQLGLGAQLLGGSLEVQHVAQRAGARASRETRWQWTIAWPSQAWLRQARAGEISTGGRRPRIVRGALLTNAPYLRPAAFGEEVFTGRPGEGWEVESFRGDLLAGFAAVDSLGAFRLAMPVNYGPNPVDVVAYGPRGEVRRRWRTILVPTERLPRGRFEYSVGGGRCTADPCREALLGDVRYGVSDRITVQAGTDAFWRDSLPALWHPWVLLSAAGGPDLNLTAEAVARGLVRGRADYDPSPGLHLDVSHVRYDTTVARPLVGSPSIRDQTEASLFWRPGGRRVGGFYLQASATRSTGAGVTRDVGRLSATAQVLGVRALAAGSRTSLSGSGFPRDVHSGVELSLDGMLHGPTALLRATFARVGVVGECDGDALRCVPRASRASASFGRQLLGAVRLDLAVTWLRGRQGLGLDVTLSTTTRLMRAVSRNTYAADFGVQGTQSFEGSILFDRRTGGFLLGSGRSVGRGWLAGVVFEDRNANGVQDEGEPGIPEVHLRVGSFSLYTDSTGAFAVSDLVPFEPTVVEVDSLSLDNPLWVPAEPLGLVSPAPNSFRFVELAVLSGGEVSGGVLFGDGARGLAGVPVRFRHILTGTTKTVTTFSDGTFYATGLRPGAYDVTVPDAALSRLGASAEALRVSVGAAEGENRVEGLTIRLQRVPPR